MPKPIATICIPTYNRSKLIQERALKSALAQDFPDYEILIVDHGSTDNTEEELKKYLHKEDYYGNSVKYIKIPQNSGIVSTARNLGAKEAKGDYIVFLDDDNELSPHFLSKTIACIESCGEDISAITSGRVVKHKDYEEYAPPYENERFISLDWGWLIKRKVFDVIQYDENMFFHEDADFGLQYTSRFGYYALDIPLQIAYAAEIGESHSSPNSRMINSMEYYLEKNMKYYEYQNNELRYLYRLMGRRCYMGGWRLKGLGYFWKSFWIVKSFKAFKHLFFILFGWKTYNWFMCKEERK